MKSFIIYAISAVITFRYIDLFSDAAFHSIFLPLLFCYFIFILIAKVMMRFFSEPMHKKPTEAEKKLARALSSRIK